MLALTAKKVSSKKHPLCTAAFTALVRPLCGACTAKGHPMGRPLRLPMERPMGRSMGRPMGIPMGRPMGRQGPPHEVPHVYKECVVEVRREV